MDMLDWQAEAFSRRVKTMNGGEKSLPNGLTSRPRLNPAFVCWLMGLPHSWTNIERTNLGSQEMESYHSALQRQLSAFFNKSDSRSKAS